MIRDESDNNEILESLNNFSFFVSGILVDSLALTTRRDFSKRDK
jgi:hypothetical protein